MPAIEFGPRTLQTIKAPADHPDGSANWVEYFDRSGGSLYLRVSSKGPRTWMMVGRVLRNGKWTRARFKLGRAAAPQDPKGMSLAEARKAAVEMKGQLREGIDPKRSRLEYERQLAEAGAKTFEALVDVFLEQYPKSGSRRRQLRETTVRDYRSLLKGAHFALLKALPIASITKSDITRVLEGIQSGGATVRANRALGAAKVLFRWLVGRGDLTSDPTDRMRAPTAENSRTRHLFAGRNKPSEIALAWRAFDQGEIFGPFLKLLLLTGARRNEVAGMRWDELDLAGDCPMWVIPGARTKNHREHCVPLGPMAAEIIAGVTKVEGCPFLFSTTGGTAVSGFGKIKQRVNAKIAALKADEPEKYAGQFDESWVLHDLRRTVKTGLASLRVDAEVRDALLNHSRRGMDAVYNHAELEVEKRDAMLLWERHVAKCVAIDAAANVTTLREAV